MLDTIKDYLQFTDTHSFEDYYQSYIFYVQDINLLKEVQAVKTNDILELDRLIARLHKELHIE